MSNQTEEQKLLPEVKSEWVAALRSGNFRQGRGLLNDLHGRYCCLGVLKKLRDLHDNKISEHILRTEAEALGMSFDIQEKLVLMNDGEKKSFAEIADWIEANL